MQISKLRNSYHSSNSNNYSNNKCNNSNSNNNGNILIRNNNNKPTIINSKIFKLQAAKVKKSVTKRRRLRRVN